MGERVDEHVWEGIKACREAYRVVLETVTYVQTESRAIGAEEIRLLFNCAEMCQATASLLRSSNPGACPVCAELCQRTADLCEQLGDDARLKTCVEACRRCAEWCVQLAAAVAAA